MIVGTGKTERFLMDSEVRETVKEAIASLAIDGKRVLLIIPDSTRTMPMPRMFELFQEFIGPRARKLDYLVALGTHMRMNDRQLGRLVGQPVVDGKVGATTIYNHEWDDPRALRTLGTVPAAEIAQITNGVLSQAVPVAVNKRIFDYDQLIICGPVFPHEVVGFSGGTKYFFPGIGGPDIINFTHWLGAVITNYDVIGSGYTPVRAVIDRAAAFIEVPTACFSLVVSQAGLSGIYFGSPTEAWAAAAALSSKKHIQFVDQPYRKVLSVMPIMYDDLWTAAKGMYKVEPIVADGGEVIIFAPHIEEVSYTHGKLIDEIGYHCRDYFLKRWNTFKHRPWGVLAHSTHVKGQGTYDVATGVESPRITVTLATRISPDRCQRINLGYRDPATINFDEWNGREAEGVLMVPCAGERLYRTRA